MYPDVSYLKFFKKYYIFVSVFVSYRYLYLFQCIIGAMFETQVNTKIKTIRLDNGTEFLMRKKIKIQN